MTTPPEPDYPYCVTITKPGHDTVHLGFPHKFDAGNAAASLTMQLLGTAHPDGTRIDHGPTPDGVTPEPPMDTSVQHIAEGINAGILTSPGRPGDDFPDTYSRLVIQEGHDNARRIWAAACSLADVLMPEITPADIAPTGRGSVTAGYDPAGEEWHVEIRIPGEDVEAIPIVAPQIPDEDTARTLAEQIADHRGLPYLPDNTGLTPAADLVEQIRAAAWMQGADDPALVAEIARLRQVEQDAIDRGWVHTNPARIIYAAPDGSTQFAAASHSVIATHLGVAVAKLPARIATPADAREIGTAWIAAAKHSEQLAAAVAAEGSPNA